MNLTSPKIIKELLLKYKAFASKSLGQHFLTNKPALDKIIRAAELNLNDIVLEIGPGIGVLTKDLAKCAKKVIAVEKDPKMTEILKETLKEFKNTEIVIGDILKILNTRRLTLNMKYKAVANLPYYIASPVIRKLLETENPPEVLVLMVQKEVAQRICAKPPKMSLFAVSVQYYAKPEIISYISKSLFWPQPKVDSAIIRITPFIQQKSTLNALFFKIVRTGFSHPRKQLINNLFTGFGAEFNTSRKQVEQWLINNSIKPAQRAETLSVKDWIKLAKSFKIS